MIIIAKWGGYNTVDFFFVAWIYFFRLKGPRWIYNAWNKMAAGRPHTCAAPRGEQWAHVASVHPRQLLPQDPRSCFRVCVQTGSSSAIISKIKQALTPLRSTKPRSHITVHVRRTAEAGWCEKPVRDPEDGRRLTLKRDDLIISGNVVFLFLFFPPPGCRRGEEKVIMAAWYVLFIHFADVYLLFNSRVC